MASSVMSIIKNLGSYIAYDRAWDRYHDQEKRQTPNWWSGILMGAILGLALFACVGHLLVENTDYVKTFSEKLQTCEERWEERRWPFSTEVAFSKFRRTTMVLNTTLNEETSCTHLMHKSEEQYKAFRESIQIWGLDTTTEKLLKIANITHELITEICKDGKVDQREREIANTLILDHYREDVYRNMSEEARVGTLNERLEMDKHLEIIEIKYTTGKIHYEQEKMALIEDVAGFSVPYDTTIEFFSKNWGLPLGVVVFFATIIFGLDGVALGMLGMQIYADWKRSTFEILRTSDGVFRKPTMITWFQFLFNLVIKGGGMVHFALYASWLILWYCSDMSRPFYSLVKEFARKQKDGRAPRGDSRTWSYLFWGSIFEAMDNTRPLFYLFCIPVVFNNICVIIVTTYLTYLAEPVSFMGFKLSTLRQDVRLRIMQFWSYKDLVLILVALCLAIYVMSKICCYYNDIFESPERTSAKKRLVAQQGWLRFAYPVLKFLYTWRRWFPVFSAGFMSVLQLLEYGFPAYIDVADGGLPSLMIQLLVPMTGMEMYVPISHREHILAKGYFR